ncbi:MAG: mechanosensitive ion channel family protein [Candidatus Promineifilaceae bacterium]|jgi:potassium efflux system protein
MESTTGVQAIADLIQTIIKFLGRAAFQRQLLAIIVVLIIAWYLSKPLITWLGRQYGQWVQRRRESLSSENLTVEAVNDQMQVVVWPFKWVMQIADMVMFPLLAILLLTLTILLFNALGWVSGLLSDALYLFALFLIYRFLLAIGYIIFDKQRVIKYQTRLFRPLFAVIIFLLVIRGITELPVLAKAPLIPLFDGLLTLGGLFIATVGLYLWIMATGLLVDILQPAITDRTNTDPRAVEAWLILLRYASITIAILIIFQIIGFSPTALAAVLGGLSIGVGFALQDVIKNFFGGIILLFEGSIRPGDWIEVKDKIGRVESLRIHSTVVQTEDNVEFIVPNQSYLNSTIVAYTYSQTGFMLKIPIKVSKDTNIKEIQATLVTIAEKAPMFA